MFFCFFNFGAFVQQEELSESAFSPREFDPPITVEPESHSPSHTSPMYAAPTGPQPIPMSPLEPDSVSVSPRRHTDV